MSPILWVFLINDLIGHSLCAGHSRVTYFVARMIAMLSESVALG